MTTRRDTIDPWENPQGKAAIGDSLLMARTKHLIYKVNVWAFHEYIYFVIKYKIKGWDSRHADDRVDKNPLGQNYLSRKMSTLL